MTITETIKYITKLRNKEVRTNSKKFKSYLQNLSPECVKELKLLNRALNDNILSIIFSSEQDTSIIAQLTTEFKNMGMPEKQMNFILKSFAEVLGWNYIQPTQEQLSKSKEIESDKESAENVKKTRDIITEKKIQENAPNLLSFVKPLILEVKKRNLEDTTARVALVIDISGSMSKNFANGTVQEIVNKILPISVQFNEDSAIDFWYYGNNPARRPSINIENYKTAVPENWKELMRSIGGRNNEQAMINEIIDEYEQSILPVYVIFVTDGGFNGESKIKKLILKSSKLPIFWQFVGISGKSYGILEKLDHMEGKYTNNANFFALDDFRSVSESELYSRLLNKFPSWLKEAKEKEILQ